MIPFDIGVNDDGHGSTGICEDSKSSELFDWRPTEVVWTEMNPVP